MRSWPETVRVSNTVYTAHVPRTLPGGAGRGSWPAAGESSSVDCQNFKVERINRRREFRGVHHRPIPPRYQSIGIRQVRGPARLGQGSGPRSRRHLLVGAGALARLRTSARLCEVASQPVNLNQQPAPEGHRFEQGPSPKPEDTVAPLPRAGGDYYDVDSKHTDAVGQERGGGRG